MLKTTVYDIHAIIALEVINNGTTMYPAGHRTCTDGKEQVSAPAQHMAAEGNTTEIQHYRRDMKQNSCNFEIPSVINIKMILRYIKGGHALLKIYTFEDIEINNQLNHTLILCL